MGQPFRILDRSALDSLDHYMRQHQLRFAFWQDALTVLAQALMEIDVTQQLAASRYERKTSRRAYRNGYRESLWQTRAGTLAIRIPKLRSGTYYPDFLEQSEGRLKRFLLHSYLKGVKYQAVQALLEDLGIPATSEQCADLEAHIFDSLELEQQRLFKTQRVMLDVLKVTDEGKERQLALAMSEEGEILDHDLRSETDEQFWQDFIRRLDQRSLYGVEYVAVGQLRHIVRLKHDSPSLSLVA